MLQFINLRPQKYIKHIFFKFNKKPAFINDTEQKKSHQSKSSINISIMDDQIFILGIHIVDINTKTTFCYLLLEI